ncbi:MAG: formimidoylglutamate deiminase [Alphaproteobacteria bacterium]|nr:formimidoylglutamate deiminase [Alphaproteobacteria bacterium]
MPSFFAPLALLPAGWTRDVRFDVGPRGDIVSVTAGADGADAARLDGPVLPGLANLHSHAFQRALAGLGERAGPQGDSFWTWRDIMYGFVRRLSPRDVEAIAAQLYVELARHGYTGVCEFHYLHNDPTGERYETPTEMADRIVAAAAAAGLGLTLLPVLYQNGGFGGTAPSEGQRRFVMDDDGYADLVERLVRRHRNDPQVRVGIAPHSLRAATPEAMARACGMLARLDATAPIHIHIAEQPKEVADCRAWSGTTPIDWLLSNAEVDGRWCLIHATHATPAEIEGIAKRGAVAGICPTTEANLGDGLFTLGPYLKAGGAFGVGSDSNVSTSPVEELRWLEYGQRLVHQARNVTLDTPGASTGAFLLEKALAGGAQAAGRRMGALAPGFRADFVVLDAESPALVGRAPDTLVDGWLFCGNANPVRDVVIGGEWVVREGHHRYEDQAAADYAKTIRRLTA